MLKKLYEKYPGVFTFLILLFIGGCFSIGYYFAEGQYDASKYPQFRYSLQTADTGLYIDESRFSRPYQRGDFDGQHLILIVRPGEPVQKDGLFWYPDAEFAGGRSSYLLYAREEPEENSGSDYVKADCMITGYYSKPTGDAIRVASGGLILEILKMENSR